MHAVAAGRIPRCRREKRGERHGRVGAGELVGLTGAPVAVAPAAAAIGRVVLYDSSDFRGKSVVIDQSAVPNLDLFGFSDRAASMRIEAGTWMFCTDERFR